MRKLTAYVISPVLFLSFSSVCKSADTESEIIGYLEGATLNNTLTVTRASMDSDGYIVLYTRRDGYWSFSISSVDLSQADLGLTTRIECRSGECVTHTTSSGRQFKDTDLKVRPPNYRDGDRLFQAMSRLQGSQ